MASISYKNIPRFLIKIWANEVRMMVLVSECRLLGQWLTWRQQETFVPNIKLFDTNTTILGQEVHISWLLLQFSEQKIFDVQGSCCLGVNPWLYKPTSEHQNHSR